jgi:hypothetical protein
MQGQRGRTLARLNDSVRAVSAVIDYMYLEVAWGPCGLLMSPHVRLWSGTALSTGSLDFAGTGAILVTPTRKELETQASHAGINHLLSRTVGVINQIRVQIAPTRDTEVAGTGSLVEWNGRRLVITAKHVIDNVKSPSDRRFRRFGCGVQASRSRDSEGRIRRGSTRSR